MGYVNNNTNIKSNKVKETVKHPQIIYGFLGRTHDISRFFIGEKIFYFGPKGIGEITIMKNRSKHAKSKRKENSMSKTQRLSLVFFYVTFIYSSFTKNLSNYIHVIHI